MNYTAILSAILNYLMRAGDAASQFINVVIFFGDNANESVSGRAYRCSDFWAWKWLMKTIDFIASPLEKDHCLKSYEADLERAQILVEAAEENRNA
jgi:hypothetical protein